MELSSSKQLNNIPLNAKIFQYLSHKLVTSVYVKHTLMFIKMGKSHQQLFNIVIPSTIGYKVEKHHYTETCSSLFTTITNPSLFTINSLQCVNLENRQCCCSFYCTAQSYIWWSCEWNVLAQWWFCSHKGLKHFLTAEYWTQLNFLLLTRNILKLNSPKTILLNDVAFESWNGQMDK